jgi:hypothetical protein
LSEQDFPVGKVQREWLRPMSFSEFLEALSETHLQAALSEAAATLAVVQGMIGHSNPAMTRHYDHAEHEADKVAAVAALPSMTGEPQGVAPGAIAPHGGRWGRPWHCGRFER